MASGRHDITIDFRGSQITNVFDLGTGQFYSHGSILLDLDTIDLSVNHDLAASCIHLASLENQMQTSDRKSVV